MVSAHKQSIYTSNAPQNPLAKPAAARDTTATSTRQPGTSTLQSAESRKRKRGQDASAVFAQRTITIRPCPAAPFDRPTILTPLKVIARAHLPLSCLDLAQPTPGSTRLFSAHIEALESNHPLAEDATTREDGFGDECPKVLVTKLQGSKTLFAVEKVRKGVYALCKLADWVQVDDLVSAEQSSTRIQPQSRYVHPAKALNNEHGGAWWAGAVIQDQQPDAKLVKRMDKTPRLLMGRPKPAALQSQTQSPQVDDPFVESQSQISFAEPMAVDGPEAQQVRPQTAEEVFQTLVQQYLEMLYLSKTSLAFFVKGPLSRARAAFTSTDGNGTLKVGELAAFFRSILLQLGQVDKKYREKIPDIVKELPLPGLSDDDDEDGAATQRAEKKKKSKSKKLKPNKEGMYTGEEEYVKQWWIKSFPSSPGGHSEETPEDMFKRKAGELRIRESMAQIILVLEILALEASPGFWATDQKETQQETQADSQQPEKKKRKKKVQDLNVLLDLLLDKLCIWQSVEQDEMLVKISKSGQGGTAAAETPNSAKAGTSDKLRGLCVEVIIPFYMGRLPEKAATINKRLGGPSASPSKATGSSSSRSKPGEATTRNPPSAQRRRKPLQRVATENATKPASRAPSLARSATDSALTGGPVFKRESSEVSLSSIPLKSVPPASSRSTSLSTFQRFAKREIDLQEMSATTEAKIRKKERIARELKEAISTLSKPNRASAVKEYADSTDRMMLAGSTRPGLTKKSANRSTTSSRVKETDRVQVGATPKKPRRTSDHLVEATPTHHRSYVVDPRDHAHHLAGTFMQRDNPLAAALPPPPSDPVVPSSVVRPGPVIPDRMGLSSSVTSAPFTFSNPPSSKSDSDRVYTDALSAQLDNSTSNPFSASPAVLATPSRPRSKHKSVSFAADDASGSNPVAETPLRPSSYRPPISSFADRLVGATASRSQSQNQTSFKLPPPPSSSSLRGGESKGVVLATPTKPKVLPLTLWPGRGNGGRGGLLGVPEEGEEDEDEEMDGDEDWETASVRRRKANARFDKGFVDDSEDAGDGNDDDGDDEVDIVGMDRNDRAASFDNSTSSEAGAGMGIHETPVKSSHGRGSREPAAESGAGRGGADADVDVYKALGWDDDDDDLL